MKIKDIYNLLDKIAPFSTAAQWDNTGLSVGSLENDVTKIVLSLDVTNDVINRAKSVGAELVITHHPLIFDPVKSVESDTVLYNAVKSGITFISTHTCLDKAENGVNTCLAGAVGIKNTYISPLDEFLNIGFVECMSAGDFAECVKNKLDCTVSFNNIEKTVKKVAFCSGSGGDLVALAAAENADVLLTGEARHHEFLLARDLGIVLMCAGHFETENIVLEYLYDEIVNEFPELSVEIYSHNPIKYI